MLYDYDAIVIGSGAGGGTFAYSCARAGKRVLLIERGRRSTSGEHVHDEQSTLIEKKPYDDRPVRVNGLEKRLYMGGILGGSTSLYGAALMRPSEKDFHPGESYGKRLDRASWDWPIDYKTLEPYYTEAESLYGVAGCADDGFGPLPRPRYGYPNRPLASHPINQRLIAANRAMGLRPFLLPLAIDFDLCLKCASCAGYQCVNGSRRSSAQLVERGMNERLPLQVLTGVEVERFCRDSAGRITAVRVLNRATGECSEVRSKRYVLAAGALASPALLLRSGVVSRWIGRNYMMHLSPIVIGLFYRRTGGDETFIKQVGFADYYFGTRRYPDKLGIVQSLPVPGPLLIRKMTAGRLPERAVQFLRHRMLPLTGIVEDLPNPANRVSLGSDGTVELHHKFSRFDLERGKRLSRYMRRILRNAGALVSLAKSFPSNEHVAHQCGTLRFGNNPHYAVADSDCRLFDHPNVFVVDGSFLPTSLGVGPALTIMANALRVADVVRREI